MNFIDVLKERRAVRKYQPVLIRRAEIEALINAAIEAPSAMNLQPWAFAAIVDPDYIESHAKRAKEWLLASMSQLPNLASARHLVEDPDFTLFHHAPAVVLVVAKSSQPQAIEDCCLAAENLMLAARDRDLGTCWIGFARPWLNLPEVKAELGLPEQYQVVAPIVLGHPVAWPESHGRKTPEVYWITPVQAERPLLAVT